MSKSRISISTPQVFNYLDFDIPYFVRSLYNGVRRWSPTFQSVVLPYSTSLPNDIESEFVGVSEVGPSLLPIIKHTWSKWSAVAQIEALEVSDPSVAKVRFFQFERVIDVPDGLGVTMMKYSNSIIQEARLGLSKQAARTPIGFKQTLMHEQGHVLGLFHGFEVSLSHSKFQILLPSEFTRKFSIMNYGSDTILDGPTAYDIAAVQYIYGPNLATGAGDTIYSLWQYKEPFANSSEAVLYTLWDSGGIDWLDAKDCLGKVQLQLGEGPYYSSTCGHSIFSLAYGANIENMRGGKGKNAFGLNLLDNIVDARESAFSSISWSENSGKDIIYGFKPERDIIFLQAKSSHYDCYYDKNLNATCLEVQGSQLCLVDVPVKQKKELIVDYLGEKRYPLQFDPYRYLRKKIKNKNVSFKDTSIFPSQKELTLYIKVGSQAFENAMFAVLFNRFIAELTYPVAARLRWMKYMPFVLGIFRDLFKLFSTHSWIECAGGIIGSHAALYIPKLSNYSELIGLIFQFITQINFTEKTQKEFSVNAIACVGGMAGHWAGMWTLKKIENFSLGQSKKSEDLNPEIENEDASGMHFVVR